MNPFYKAKIAFNSPLSLGVRLLTTQIWPDMGKERGENKKGAWRSQPFLTDFFNESTKGYLKYLNMFLLVINA